MPRENRCQVSFPGRRSIIWWSWSHFSWQGQHFVKFWKIAGARNVVFIHTKCISKMGRVRSPKRRVRDDDFMPGWSSDHGRIVFILAEAIQGFCAEILNSEFRGMRGTWWVWRVTLLAPRIVNDVSYVTRINHESHFAWQAPSLMKLEADSCCSAHCKWRFICDADESWQWVLVPGAELGEGAVRLFVARTAFREILGDSLSARGCIFQYKIVSKIGRVRSPKWRVRDGDTIVGLS